MAAKDLAGQHSRQHDIIGKFSLPDALGTRIDLAEGFADYV